MKPKHLLLLCCILGLFKANAQIPFITTWNASNSGVSDSTHIIFYATGDNFHIGWVNMSNASDTGNVVGTNGADTISFPAPGMYKVYITPGSGNFSAIRIVQNINNDSTKSDCNKLLSIEQWGDINWSTFNSAFANCHYMVMDAPDIPNLSSVTDMSAAFYKCYSLTTNDAMSNWDVSNVTDMNEMFEYAIKINQPIGNWNVSNVTNMNRTFANAYVFNQPIGKWDVSNVTNMNDMFFLAVSFNQLLGSWNVSKVTDMAGMFFNATSFNQPIDNWNVSNVIYMNAMFYEAKSFNQVVGNWNVSNVINMEGMFSEANNFNQPIGDWNVSNVEDMSEMFSYDSSFNQNLSNWKLNNLRYGSGDFNSNSALNMFNSCGINCNNYSATLRGWAANTSLPKNQILGAAGLTYDSSTAKAAHDSLININGWTISGDTAGHCSGILPVNFISFNVFQHGNAASLNWKIANEINVKGYAVEKSANSFNYSSIGFVAAKDNKQTNYTSTDNNLYNGITYYRIKEIDNDGKFMYSSVQKIEYSKFAWKVNGNPVSNSFVTLMLNKPANVSIQIISSTGNVIKTINKGNLIAGNYSIALNIDNTGAGLYLIRLIVDDKAYTSTILKQ